MSVLNPFSGGQKTQSSELDRAILATRQAADRQALVLSARARTQILDTAHKQAAAKSHGAFQEPLLSLFTSRSRLFAVGALPVLLGVGLLVLLNGPMPAPPPEFEGASTLNMPVLAANVSARVSASKAGDQVQFRIANGGRPHRVLRSTTPRQFDAASAVTVEDGAYVDPVEDSADLVFYRIE